MKVTKKPVFSTPRVYKIIHCLIIMSKSVFYCPWVFDKLTGTINYGRYRTIIIPFIFFLRFFMFVFYRFNYLEGIEENPFLVLSLCRGTLFTIYQFYYMLEIVSTRKQVTNLIKELQNLVIIVNPPDRILRRIYWETIFIFILYIIVLITVSLITTSYYLFLSFSQVVVLFFFYQYVCCTYVFDCHIIVLLRLIAVSMDALSYNLKWTVYNEDGILSKTIFSERIFEMNPIFDKHFRTIGDLRKICRRLYNLKDSLANCYKGRLISSSVMMFTDLAFFSYATFIFFMVEGNRDLSHILGGNGYVCLNFLKLFFITTSGQRVETAATNLSANLMKLITVNTPRTVSTELLALSHELLHRTPSVNIRGLFKLNDGLGVSILSSSLTYVMILLQFNMKSSSDQTRNPVDSLLSFF